MPSFRIISLLATIACAVFSNAAPTTTPAEVSNLGNAAGSTLAVANTRSFDRRDTDLPGVPDDIAQGYKNAVSTGDVAATPSTQDVKPRDEQAQSIPIILVSVTNQIIPVVRQIRAIVVVDVQIDVLAGLIVQIHDIVAGAIVDIRVLAANPTVGVLALGARILSIQEVAYIVATILYLIFTALEIVVRTVAVVQLQVVAPLVISVGGVVASLLFQVFLLVGGLSVVVVPLVTGLVATLVALDLNVVVHVLGLST
ncbi:uncharacterized protein LACBIDRAFT_294686 [Laccaria bicolor S238N-H82]|uniref:Predicted protein n=1 Tax=Laccaria bicolor (strain S238N-H82 / ATCC MYA-4686) TaxID=486041 RepID=B0DGK3_LACBS|nr:uncharacterized protein LACBIDRAFT_294686 [Laccaria bicolor S238N-H82]EDR06168.1 predicted protein [Laccaria bicolor S238N-H82]|eukprot:XP_001883029.1 predicted protein [Laccaria bicolor S238N-H82]